VKPVLKIELKRADGAQLVKEDAVLKASELVTALGSTADAVLRSGTALRFAAKSKLFEQGHAGHSVFFVIRGDVRLAARNEGSDDSFDLGLVHAGEFVGEAEVLAGGGMRAFSALADNPVEALELARASLTSAQGQLPRDLMMLFERARKRRQASLDEMNDFLNRW